MPRASGSAVRQQQCTCNSYRQHTLCHQQHSSAAAVNVSGWVDMLHRCRCHLHNICRPTHCGVQQIHWLNPCQLMQDLPYSSCHQLFLSGPTYWACSSVRVCKTTSPLLQLMCCACITCRRCFEPAGPPAIAPGPPPMAQQWAQVQLELALGQWGALQWLLAA
jgi:hypothetical protein